MLSNRSMPVLEDAGSFEQLAAYRESSVEWASPEGTITLAARPSRRRCSPCCGRSRSSAGCSPTGRRARVRTGWCC